MKLIVISSPESVPNEKEIIISLFENGLEFFHLHKPNFSEEEISNFIREIPYKHHNKIFLHSSFPKFHSLKELNNYKEEYEYAFLSPVFDSISKKDYKSKFNHRVHGFSHIKPVLTNAISGKSVIALGGIDEDKIELCHKLGFAGVAVLGAIWQNDNKIEKFKRLQTVCQKKDLVF